MATGKDKREYARINDQFGVRLGIKNDVSHRGTIEINTSKSINISAKGILLNMKEKIDTGTALSITFIKPNTFEFFKGTGRVVHVEEDKDKTYNVGINFVDLTPDDMKMLDYYINLGVK